MRLTLRARAAYYKALVSSREADEKRRVKQAEKARRRAVKHRGKPDGQNMADLYHRASERLAATRKALLDARRALAKVKGQLKAHKPLRLRALANAEALVGVMEQGGNNMGPRVSQIIRENGGTGPEPWCGDFVAYCYRHAGSKMVTRGWAAVRILGWLTGMKVLDHPVPGAIVIYTFDHTGLVERLREDGQLQTVEGNTGASGAVSDSATGGDGVYRKVRPRGLVRRYVLPTR